MIVNNSETAQSSTRPNRWLPWFNMILAILLIALGIWYLAGRVSFLEIIQALLLANPGYVIFGLTIMIATVVLKAWRWQLMFRTPDGSPPYTPLFWSLMLGQYVNLIVPFLRLGEIARIYALNRQTDIPMARSLGTLVVEKVLDAFMLAMTIGIVLPLVILPEFVSNPGIIMWVFPLAALLVLYLLAYQTDLISRFFHALADKLPTRFAKRFLHWSLSGLEGLAALRNTRLSLLLVGSSAVIAFLSVLLPFVMFGAFDLKLGFIEAAAIHIVVTIATTPPSTPGKIGVFNGAVALVLLSFGMTNEAVAISYSILFYLVVIVPQIVLGSIAASRTDWRWHKSAEQQMAAEST
jgi:uncharacterized protein (TIRG00374 family)